MTGTEQGCTSHSTVHGMACSAVNKHDTQILLVGHRPSGWHHSARTGLRACFKKAAAPALLLPPAAPACSR